jgi:hypothetical protein
MMQKSVCLLHGFIRRSKVGLGRLGCGFNYISGSGFGKGKNCIQKRKYEEVSRLEEPDFSLWGPKNFYKVL